MGAVVRGAIDAAAMAVTDWSPRREAAVSCRGQRRLPLPSSPLPSLSYADHQREMGDATLVAPVIFLKPPSAAVCVREGEGRVVVQLPRGRGSVHYECEIVLRVGADGGGRGRGGGLFPGAARASDLLPRRSPASSFDQATQGLDHTQRDVQADARAKGSPWETAKVWPGSAVLGPWLELGSVPDWLDTEFTFELNGTIVQRGLGRDMVSGPAAALAAATATVGVSANDLFFTGTPAGVGPLAPGDVGWLRWGGWLAVEAVFE